MGVTETDRQVTYNNDEWGNAVVTETSTDIIVKIQGKYIDDKIYRAYGVSADKAVLLIGVLEPCGKLMTIGRNFSKSNLKNLNYYPDLPQQYFICENKWHESNEIVHKNKPIEPIESLETMQPNITQARTKTTYPKTKDQLVNNILSNNLVSWEITGSLLTIYCEFSSSKAFPLSFAFSTCTVEQRENKTVACFRCWL